MSTRFTTLAAASSVALTLSLAVAETASAFSVSYDQEVTAAGRVITSTVRLKDEQFRIETPVEGITNVIVRNRSGLYHYKLNERTATKLSPSSVLEYRADDLENFSGYLADQHAALVGSETVNGYPAEIYRFTDPSSGGVTTTWVWKDKQFPVKIEQESPEGKIVAVMTNVQLGVDIPDAVFQLPAGMTVAEPGP